MSSKINVVDGSRTAAAGAGRGTQRPQDAATGLAAGAAGTPADGTAPENVHITDTASHLASLAQSLHQLPAVDEARVATLRNAIEQGTYAVAPQRVAAHLLQMEQALGSVADGNG